MSADLHVFLDGTHVGTLTQSPGGAVRFTYDETYRAASSSTPLSLSMPLRLDMHPPRVTQAFLWGLLPDSEGARDRLARQYGVSPRNPFSLLRHIGRDAAGAVQILPGDESPADASAQTGDIRWLTEDDVASLLDELGEHVDDWDPGAYAGRWSLAGAQPKVALFHDPHTLQWGIPEDATPTTHVLKPVTRGLPQHHVNEFLCLRAAEAAGLPTAAVHIMTTSRSHALVSTRYDRYLAGGRWHRRHQEDMCQALSIHPRQKYQSDGGPGVSDIASVFRRLRPDDRAASTRRFFAALAFNVLVGGTDAHAKNYSMILAANRAQLAPMYDVASAAPYRQHERLTSPMKIGRQHRFLDVADKDWTDVARKLGLPADECVDRVRTLRASLPQAFGQATESLPSELRDLGAAQAERILAHVDGTWRPDLVRDPRHVLDSTPVDDQSG